MSNLDTTVPKLTLPSVLESILRKSNDKDCINQTGTNIISLINRTYELVELTLKSDLIGTFLTIYTL